MPARNFVTDDPSKARWSRGSGPRRLVTLAAIILPLALVAPTLTPRAVSAAASPSCDAVCAQAVVHTPGKVRTRGVRWSHYPYATQTRREAIDPWGSVERQCTGYVTWALNAMGVDFGMRDRGKNGRTVTFLAAGEWAKAAHRGGWTVSDRPVVGSVAQWGAAEKTHWRIGRVRWTFTPGSSGHVGIVTHVYRDGTALIRQYNASDPGRTYSTMRGKAARYLRIGVK